jgi:exosortase A-associated hydrolase 1
MILMNQEIPITFACQEHTVVGIVHSGNPKQRRGVLVVVGGPQTRVGSHRQFLLLARYLAAQGVPVLRFDYRGMGDTSGAQRTFEDIDEDIRAAIDAFYHHCDQLNDVVIWGLCDAASAAMFYAHRDPRVSGLVMLNPWARTVRGEAKAYLKHYYVSRLTEPAFWKKVRHGEFDAVAATKSLCGLARAALGFKHATASPTQHTTTEDTPEPPPSESTVSLPDRMADGLEKFHGQLLFIFSGNDLTAAEFLDMTHAERRWRKFFKKRHYERYDIPEANHTFSRKIWRDDVAQKTLDWIQSW